MQTVNYRELDKNDINVGIRSRSFLSLSARGWPFSLKFGEVDVLCAPYGVLHSMGKVVSIVPQFLNVASRTRNPSIEKEEAVLFRLDHHTSLVPRNRIV